MAHNWDGQKEINLIKHLDGVKLGYGTYSTQYYNRHWYQIKSTAVKSCLPRLYMQDMFQFEKRVSSVAWHQRLPHMVVAASKSGEMSVFQGHRRVQDESGVINFKETFKTGGTGPGGSITAMKFSQENSEHIYVASMEGKVGRLNLDYSTQSNQIYEDSKCYEIWFTAMDVSPLRKLMAAGNTAGELFLIPLDGADPIFSRRNQLHKRKILHCEFHPRDPNVMVTSGLDHVVKIWDLRNIQDKKPITILEHNKGCNVARFSPDGSRLLTNDQDDEIRIYDAPFWEDPLIITHHHRQFQHITPIKANWHPLAPIIIVGLYPPGRDKTIPRPLQFIDADTGSVVQELDTSFNGIQSLASVNITGEIVASSSGGRFMFWQTISPELKLGASSHSKKKTGEIPAAMINALRGRRDDSEDDDDEDEGDNSPPKKRAKRGGKSSASATSTTSKAKDKGKGQEKEKKKASTSKGQGSTKTNSKGRGNSRK